MAANGAGQTSGSEQTSGSGQTSGTGHKSIRRRTRDHWLAALLCAVAGALVVVLTVMIPPSYDALPDACGDRLTIAGGTDVSLGNQRRALVESWNAGGRGTRPQARLVEVSPSADLQYSQLKAAQEAGTCAYDVLIMDAQWTAEFAHDGRLKVLDEIDKSALADARDFFPAALALGTYEGRQYTVPFNLDVGLLYHRDKAKVPARPQDWPSENHFAQLGDYEGLTVNALEFAWNHGGTDVLTGTRRPTRAELAGRVHPALKAVAQRMRSGKPLWTSLMRGFKEQESIDAFTDGGDDTLLRHWPYAYRHFANDPRLRDGGDLRFGVTAPPGHTVLGGQSLAVSASSRHQKDALALIQYLTSTESQRQYFSCGGFAPTRFSAFGLSPGVLRQDAVRPIATCSERERQATNRDNAGGEPDSVTPQRLTELAKAVVAALERARPRPVTEHYATFSTTFRGCARKIFTGVDVPADTFAKAIDESLDGKTASC
ncbi:extracellular solute-binding protein [Spirillospora sp. NPDC048911]|uniref:extracellular solute-binding protein n=1 Tax=Spirillospora sp. NPDC048911 TaxID=3364527 RepID=UPI003721A31B